MPAPDTAHTHTKTSTPRLPVLSRRLFMGGLAGSALAVSSAHGQEVLADSPLPNTLPGTAEGRIIIAGTAETLCGRWASLMTPLMAQALHHNDSFQLQPTTGWDGVTGANLFETRQQSATSPLALIAPGSAMLAAMVGDSRVHYDYQRWLAILSVCQPTVTIGRVALHRSLGTMLGNHRTRVAVSSPTGLELPMLLAFELLGLRPQPITGQATPEAAMAALTAGTVDAIQLPLDPQFPERAAALAQQGFGPLFLNTTHAGTQADMTGLPPDFMSILQQERPKAALTPLAQAWLAATAAANTKAVLLLPLLSQPATVARWRNAAEICAAMPQVRQAASADRQTLLTGADCMALYSQLMPDTTVIMALRRWLASNLPQWRDMALRGKT